MLRLQTLPLGYDKAVQHKKLCLRVANPHRGCTIWYMNTEDSVEIDAPPPLVWDVFTDVERWPEWTASVTSLTGLDGPTLAVGKRSPGVRVSARHDVTAHTGGRTLVRQQLDQRGVLGALVGRLMIKKTKRFLELEGHGLKARAEQLSRADGAHS